MGLNSRNRIIAKLEMEEVLIANRDVVAVAIRCCGRSTSSPLNLRPFIARLPSHLVNLVNKMATNALSNAEYAILQG